jgi:hypothetical protein
MRLVVFKYVVLAVGLAILWLVAGRRFSLIVDHVLRLPVVSMPVKAIHYDGGGLVIDKFSMTFGQTSNLRADLCLCDDSQNRVVLKTGGRSFVLGPRTNPVDPNGRPEIDFVPEDGDEVSFRGGRSLIGWPTPFETYIMIRSPWWKRYVYYRLTWKKKSGARMDMSWRYEQDYFAPGRWTEPQMMWNSQTGLLDVAIEPSK